MNTFKCMIAAAGLAAICSCSTTKEEPETVVPDHDDSYYAALATIGSDSGLFTPTDEGGTINFTNEGGQVAVNVDCGTLWTVQNQASDLYTATADPTSGVLTVTAQPNYLTQRLSGTMVLLTSSTGVSFATLTVNQDPYDSPTISVGTASLRFPAVGELTAEITVDSSLDDWAVDGIPDWLFAERTETGVSLTASENSLAEERAATLTLTCGDGHSSASATVAVSQDARASITLSRSGAAFPADGGSFPVTVESNVDWDFSYDTSAGWFTVQRSGDTLTATASADDDGLTREATVTVSGGNDDLNTASATLKLTQYGPDALILQYIVGSSDFSLQIPLAGTVDCTVDWGDGMVENVTTAGPSHGYSSMGIFNVCVSGTVTGLSGADFEAEVNETLSSVLQWGATGLTDMSGAFYNCTNLTSLPEVTGDALAEVTSFDRTFYKCSSLAALPEDIFSASSKALTFELTFFYCISLTDIPEDLFAGCPEVTSFYGVFEQMKGIKTIPAGLFSHNPKVENLRAVFYQCPALTAIPEGLFDYCPENTSFMFLFYGDSLIKEIPKGLFANCPKVTTFYGAFYNCTSLTEVPDGIFSANSAAEDFTNVFYGCTGVKTLPDGLFSNCQNATSFQAAFYNCTSLTEIPDGLFSGCSRATNFYGAFRGDSALKSIPDDLFAGCSAAEDFSYVFNECSALESLPENLFADSPEALKFTYAFEDCKGLTSLPAGLFANNFKIIDIFATFINCTGLTGESPYNMVDGAKVHLYQRSNYPDVFPVSSITHLSCFSGCTGLSDYGSMPLGWK